MSSIIDNISLSIGCSISQRERQEGFFVCVWKVGDSDDGTGDGHDDIIPVVVWVICVPFQLNTQCLHHIGQVPGPFGTIRHPPKFPTGTEVIVPNIKPD
jgi:hypothetical protein